MTPEERAQKRSTEYAALHKQMEQQRADRRATGLPVQTGDLLQVDIGGDFYEVIEHENAGMYFRRKAEERAAAARTERNGNN